jgi:hypothetical protein
MNFKAKMYVLSAALFLLWSACRKVDQQPARDEGSTPAIKESRFFTEHRSTNPQVQSIMQWLQNKNAKKDFVTQTSKQIGFPYWDKALITNPPNRGARGASDSGLVIYIPFVRDSQNYVNASMVVELNPEDTAMSYICDWQYDEKVRSNTSVDSSAESYAMFFMYFTKTTLGQTRFKITDNTLFASHPRLTSADSLEFNFYDSSAGRVAGRLETNTNQICVPGFFCGAKTSPQCINGCDWQDCSADPDVCHFVWECITYPGGDNGGTGGTGGDGGSGGTGGSGGNGGGGGTTTPPECGGPTTGSRTESNLPCTPGWTPVPVPDNPPQPTTIFSSLTNPINVPDSSFVSYPFTLVQLLDTTPTGRLIARSLPRGNTEDMTWGYDHDSSGINMLALGLPWDTDSAALFDRMDNLFYWCTFFDNELRDVGDLMIQRFKERTGQPFSSPILNHKVFEAGKFQDYIKTVIKQIDDSLKLNGENINSINIDSLSIRPHFNGLYHKFHGLQILVNDTESTDIYIDNFVQNQFTKLWSADITFVIKDHFGLDKPDAITYQYDHSGFIAWWLLQHRRGFRPFETVITVKIRVTVPR